MSIGTLTTIGVTRDTEPVTRKDTGKAKAGEPDESAKMRDVLVAGIPTELVAPYTFLITMIVGFIDIEKKRHLDQFKPLRWALFGFLVVATLFFIWDGVRRKRAQGSWMPVPVLEVVSAGLAAAIWGLTVPESPLILELNGDNRIIVPLVILIVGGIVYGSLSSGLTNQRRKQ